MLRYFRHGPLTFYTIAVLAVSTILAVGYTHTGSHAAVAVQYGTTPDRVTLQGVFDRMGEMKLLESAPGPGLTQWAAGTERIAQLAYKRRVAGYGTFDPLSRGWHALATDAADMRSPSATVWMAAAGRVEGDVNMLFNLISLSPTESHTQPTLPAFPTHTQ